MMEPAHIVGGEYDVRLCYTFEYHMTVTAGSEEAAVDEADLLRAANDPKPSDWDLVHSEVEQTREIYEDEVDAPKVADWIDEPNVPSEETYWDDSRHFDSADNGEGPDAGER